MSILPYLLFHSPWLYRLTRIVLGCVFIGAGCAKLMDPRAFARVISGYNLVPDVLLVPVAIGLPAIEFLVGLGLSFDIRGSLKAVSGLLALFIFVLGYGILSDLEVDCGCFSSEEIHARDSLRTAFYRDLGLMSMVVYLFAWRWVRRRSGSGEGCGVQA